MSNDLMQTLQSGGLALQNTEAKKKLLAINKKMASGGSTYRRISIKGGKFRQIVGGEQVQVSKDESMRIIILNSSAVSRMYYAGAYDPSSKGSAPTCWSHNSNEGVPGSDVPEHNKQAESCDDCPQNVKGSGAGESRACRYSQRLAVLIEGDWKNIYQLSLPATSLFGAADGDKMGLGAYMKLLSSNEVPAAGVVTEMTFDENSEVPKLFFKPTRFLDDDEVEQVVPMVETPEVIDVITLTVAEVDGIDDTEAKKPAATAKPKVKVKRKPKPKPKPAPEPVVEEEEEVPEPTVKDSDVPDEDDEDGEINALLDDWDDEEED